MSSNEQQQHEEGEEAVAENAPQELSFASEEAALEGRREGLAAYNAGDMGTAIVLQEAVVRFFVAKNGEVSAANGTFFLDYGLSLLTELQCVGGEGQADAALGGADAENEEDVQTCYLNLRAAEKCFDAAEDDAKGDAAVADVTFNQAEVHDTIGQFYLEVDHSDDAAQEFEASLLYLRTIEGEAGKAKRVQKATATALYNIARCYLSEADFAGAADRLTEAVSYVDSLPPDTIAADIVAEMRALLEDAIDDRENNTYAKTKATIGELFPPEGQEVPEPVDVNGPGAVAFAAACNPLVSDVPGGGDAGHSQHSVFLTPSIIPGRENSNSTSRSVFPRVGGNHSRSGGGGDGGSNSSAPNVVVVHKKPKRQPVVGVEPETKKARTE